MTNGQLLLCVFIIILFILLHNNINIQNRKNLNSKEKNLKDIENFIAEYEINEANNYINNNEKLIHQK